MAPTQAALYRELSDDLHLSWSERELPERERTNFRAAAASMLKAAERAAAEEE